MSFSKFDGQNLDMLLIKPKEAASLDIPDLVSRLSTDIITGLTTSEIYLRQKIYGDNELKIHKTQSIIFRYINQFKDPLIMLLLLSSLISVVMKEFDNALSIAVAIIIVVSVGFVQEYRSEKSLEALSKLMPHNCRCIRDGSIEEILAESLVPGDIIEVNTGDRIPADIRLFESIDLEVDESSFTGETAPSIKTIETKTLTDIDISGFSVTLFKNLCFMGTYICSGHGKGIVFGTGANTEFGDIFKLMQSEESPKTPLQRSMDSLGKQLSFYSLCIIVIILLLGWLQHGNILEMFTIAVSLAVAAIPEGLPIVVTVTLALGVMRMAKKNAIAKKLPVVETLACVNVVCSDKTGTLTQNRMEVVELYTPDHNVVHVGGDSFKCDRENGENVLYYPSITKIVKIGTICNNAHWKDGKLIGQAVEKALLSLAEKLNCLSIRENYVRISEHSFRSDQKWMAVNVLKKQECVPSNENKDSVWFMKGSLETVLRQCSHMSYDQTPLSTKTRHCLEGVANQMARRGHRVLAFAEGQDLMNLGFVGLAAFSDCLRDGVALAVADLLNGGVEVKMITGDSFETAQAVAKDIGILKEDSVCISGEELEKFESLSNKLVELVNCASVFYRVTPVHKVTIVKALQLSGKVVAMTGDGTNDAIAVKRAEIGIAMGVVGTDVCREAADLILTDDNFSTILRAVEEGKGIYYNIRNFVRFQLSTSMAALSLIAVCVLLGLPSPLNAMQILWINIIMDGPPAQSLGVEPVDADIMKQPPRKLTDQVIDFSLLLRVLSSAVVILCGTLFVFLIEADDDIVSPRDTTMTFTCFVFFDMFNAFSCRSINKSVFSIGLLTNQTLVYSITGSVICQLLVVYFPPLQTIFQTEPIRLLDIVFLTLLSSSVLIVDEVFKKIKLVLSHRQLHSKLELNV